MQNDIIHSFKLPEKFYTDKYNLVNIQNVKQRKEILFKFRKENDKVVYHRYNSIENYFYLSDKLFDDAPVVENVKNLKLRFDKKDITNRGLAFYNEDIPIELKHSVDYYFNRSIVKEYDYKLRVLFWDIEVFTFDDKGFPFPEEAKHPINAISFKLNKDDKTYVYILKLDEMDKTTIKELDGCIIKLFNTEKELIESFCEKIVEFDVDIMSGWNTSNFDQPYLFNRMHKLNIDFDELSPIGLTSIDLTECNKSVIYGLSMVDQLFLYKKCNQNLQSSYKLSNIAQIELGKDKVAYEGTLDNVYETDINTFILYSKIDTDLLQELEDKSKHIELYQELIKICSSTWERSITTSGLVDPLFIKFSKNNNKVCKNRSRSVKDEPFSGAYVIEPQTGFYKWVVDFDFSSLYPSVICTMNLGHNTFVAKVSNEVAKNYLYNRDKLEDNIEINLKPLHSIEKYVTISKDKFLEIADKCIVTITGCIFKKHETEKSFLSEIILHLMNSRKMYKKELGNIREILATKELTEDEKEEYKREMQKMDTRQWVYKIINNSIYGIISMKYSRMFNLDIAKTITATGQEALKYSITHLSNYLKNDSLEINNNFIDEFEEKTHDYIVYGDTDSLFVSLGDFLVDKNIIGI